MVSALTHNRKALPECLVNPSLANVMGDTAQIVT